MLQLRIKENSGNLEQIMENNEYVFSFIELKNVQASHETS